MREFVGDLCVSQSRRVFSTRVRRVGDFDLAEEAMHEAFATATEQWNQELIAEVRHLVEHSLASRRFGVYTIEAEISAVHADAPALRRPAGQNRRTAISQDFVRLRSGCSTHNHSGMGLTK
jgi:predicted RNA polymerase sigma factor